MAERTYYEILGVGPKATAVEIRRSFHALARKYHPDSSRDSGSEIIFQQISEAYTVLSDSEKRKQYDRKYGILGEVKEKFESYQRAAQSYAPPTPEEPDLEGEDRYWARMETKRAEERGFAVLNNARFNGSGIRRSLEEALFHIPEKPGSWFSFLAPLLRRLGFKSGENIETFDTKSADKVTTTLRGERQYHFTIDALESLCGASREVAVEEPRGPRVFKVNIPAGLNDGASVRIRCPARGGGNELEIKAIISIAPHQFVEREGQDILVKVPITVSEAVHGTQLDIPTLIGSVRVKIPPLSQENRRLRLKGRGVVSSDGMAGDLYVKPYIVPPDKGTKELEEALKTIESHYLKQVRKDLPRQLKSPH